MICRNADLGTNYDEHIFVRAMGRIIKWHSFWDPLILMHPLRPLVNWYNGRIVNNWIQTELHKRYEEIKFSRRSSTDTEKKRARSVLDLAIEGYIDSKGGKTPQELDPDFVRIATYQVRLFLFAGNDSTSSTIIFVFHLLSKHPKVLSQLRSEHDAVFGRDVSEAADRIRRDPSLLGKCKVTNAVIKETLRLYAPAATMRLGGQDCCLASLAGTPIPTDGMGILLSHHSMHRNPRLWPRAEEFLPERWLVGSEHELYPQPGAWRPFELGPRACIGQTLSTNELKIVLVLAVRKYDVKPAYEEHDKMKMGSAGRMRQVFGGLEFGAEKIGAYRGDRAYQTEKAGAHPSEAYPCYVSTRK